ncbi:MAG: iron ABC transporter permease [Myxococcota bacterium]
MRRRLPTLTRKRLLGVLGVLGALELAALTAALCFGSTSIALRDLAAWAAGGQVDPLVATILGRARLPRALFGGVVGGALAVGGAIFQAILRNPLADPYVLGISGGAALGGTLFLALAPPALLALGVPGSALLGALGALGLMLWAARHMPPGRTGVWALLLTGVLFNAFASAMITFLKAIVTAQKAQELLFYLMGTLSIEGTPRAHFVVASGVMLAALLASLGLARDLDLMTLGEDEARSLGVDIRRVRLQSVGYASVAVAVAVAYTGLIGFVGLVVPHGLRAVLGPDHRLLLPACALGGASFLTACDTIARASFDVFSTTLPVGVITALVGAPLFAALMWRRGA